MEDKNLLIVIDVQKNFINENTEFLIDKIYQLLNSHKFDDVVFTKFINEQDSPFYKVLNWKGCMSKEDQKIVLDTQNYKVWEKRTYTAVTHELINYIKENKIATIYLCGIDTDACVLKTALDLFDMGYNVKIIENCTMSHSGQENHDMAIHLLKKLIGKDNIITV